MQIILAQVAALLISCDQVVDNSTNTRTKSDKGSSAQTNEEVVHGNSGDGSEGSYIVIPPDSEISSDEVYVEQGATVANQTTAAHLHMDGDIRPASQPILVSSSYSNYAEGAGSLQMSIPVEDEVTLQLAAVGSIHVFYHVMADRMGGLIYGVIPTREIQITEGRATFAFKGFGNYQLGRISVEEKSSRTVSTFDPILNASGDVVIEYGKTQPSDAQVSVIVAKKNEILTSGSTTSTTTTTTAASGNGGGDGSNNGGNNSNGETRVLKSDSFDLSSLSSDNVLKSANLNSATYMTSSYISPLGRWSAMVFRKGITYLIQPFENRVALPALAISMQINSSEIIAPVVAIDDASGEMIFVAFQNVASAASMRMVSKNLLNSGAAVQKDESLPSGVLEAAAIRWSGSAASDVSLMLRMNVVGAFYRFPKSALTNTAVSISPAYSLQRGPGAHISAGYCDDDVWVIVITPGSGMDGGSVTGYRVVNYGNLGNAAFSQILPTGISGNVIDAPNLDCRGNGTVTGSWVTYDSSGSSSTLRLNAVTYKTSLNSGFNSTPQIHSKALNSFDIANLSKVSSSSSAYRDSSRDGEVIFRANMIGGLNQYIRMTLLPQGQPQIQMTNSMYSDLGVIPRSEFVDQAMAYYSIPENVFNAPAELRSLSIQDTATPSSIGDFDTMLTAPVFSSNPRGEFFIVGCYYLPTNMGDRSLDSNANLINRCKGFWFDRVN